MASGEIQTTVGIFPEAVVVMAGEQPTLQIFFDPDYAATTRFTLFWRAYASLESLQRYLNASFTPANQHYNVILDYDSFEFSLPLAPAPPLSRLTPTEAEAGIYATYGEPASVRYEVYDKRFPTAPDLVLWGALATNDEIEDFQNREVIEQHIRREVGLYMTFGRAHPLLQATPFHELLEQTLVPNTSKGRIPTLVEFCLSALRDRLPSHLREDPSPFYKE